ncbi:MAG: hypothetical protein A2X18_01440 [Bacteroidetes bacterium GWF2_40_14]|nr:MAG: hypothetical protein A2X18_01440 [Bacteroidetes bacterium GWF2_40_14]
MRYRCLIIDDEPIAIKVISNYLEQLPHFEVAGGFTNAFDSLNDLHSNHIDLLFLDIMMPGINGLEFIRSLTNPPKVIFTTAYRNYAPEAFDVDALDYLVKPIPFERFLKAVNKFLEIQERRTINNTSETIILKSDKKNYKVFLDDILYIESMDDYIKVHTKHTSLVCYLRLSGIENLLDKSRFIRIHRAYIINREHVSLFTNTHIEIAGKLLPVGRSYREEVPKRLI